MPLEIYHACVFARLVIAIISGPTVTVIIGNSLKLFFDAFSPQSIDPKGNDVGVLLSKMRVRLVSRLSGACLIGGGLSFALTRAR